MNDNPAIKGLIELIEKRYGLEVLDSHYVLVDEKFKQYNMRCCMSNYQNRCLTNLNAYIRIKLAPCMLRGALTIKIILDSTLLLATISFCF